MIVLAALLAICAPHGARSSCVYDGDTFWLNGEKIRIADIDTPELDGRCEEEREGALAARDRLMVLLNGGSINLRRQGEDRYGRTLAVVMVDGRSVGRVLESEGLARRWDGRRRAWC